MDMRITITVQPEDVRGLKLLAPTGLASPYHTPVSFAVKAGVFSLTGETATAQMAAVIEPEGSAPVQLVYDFVKGGPGYPETLFHPALNRYTRAANELVKDARRIAATAADGHAAIEAIVNDVAHKFDYGHPDIRYYEGHDEVPYLSCGVTQGSCVDINTYLIACLRSAGFEAGYVTGYFFPQEKNGTCNDMHCWVVSRHNGVVLEWDIAHHLKMGTRIICCGLNPKPGMRAAIAHSMGLDFPSVGVREAKLLGEPAWIGSNGKLIPAKVDIQMEPGVVAGSGDAAA